jgi:hypothetical protein
MGAGCLIRQKIGSTSIVLYGPTAGTYKPKKIGMHACFFIIFCDFGGLGCHAQICHEKVAV